MASISARAAYLSPARALRARSGRLASTTSLFIAEAGDGRIVRAAVKGDMDPGYGSTAKMLGEAAVCLARDVPRVTTPGGCWTSAAAMGDALIRRLEAHAGLTFTLEN